MKVLGTRVTCVVTECDLWSLRKRPKEDALPELESKIISVANMSAKMIRRLFAPVHASSLGVFRIGFVLVLWVSAGKVHNEERWSWHGQQVHQTMFESATS